MDMRDSLRIMKSQFVRYVKADEDGNSEIESYYFQNHLDSKYKRIYRLKWVSSGWQILDGLQHTQEFQATCIRAEFRQPP
jgi:hypothetical protein